MAVWLVVLLLERPLVELFETEGADEVLRMEFLEHSRYAAARYWFVAAGAQRATFSMVVGLAVRLALVVEERTTVEGLMTFLRNVQTFKHINNFMSQKIFYSD